MLQGSPSAANKSAPHTAVVDIKGEDPSGAEASAEFVVAAMRSAFEDEGSKAVVLLINSPRGSPVQAGIINDEITRLKAKHNKPVYAVVEETCASAAYYIAAAADEIFVDKAQHRRQHWCPDGWFRFYPHAWKSWAWSVACSRPGKTRVFSTRSALRPNSSAPTHKRC